MNLRRLRIDDLNPAQRDAVTTENGPLLVLAGAGTGKTRVVTYRIARLIQQGLSPERILAVTFTNKAADEMQQRIADLIGRRRESKPEISTFHSYCLRVLRRQAKHLGLRPNFSIYAAGQPETLARRVLKEVDVSGLKIKPGELLSRISSWKNQSMSPGDAAAQAVDDRDHLAAAAFRRYQIAIESLGAVDFDDLLLLTQRLFREKPEIRSEEAGRFQHIMVDEYQDTNSSQYRIVKALAEPHRNLCVVGDDDQSIYGWRGAEVTHILRFRHDWPDAKVVRLEQNYRSTGEIVRYANRLIRCNLSRHDKTLNAARGGGITPRVLACKDEIHEARSVIEDIRRQMHVNNYEPRDIAILFRTNEQPRPFEAELRRWNVPYIILGSMSFFDRREVRDTLAFLKLLDDPRDDPSLLRVINVPPRGISDKAIGALSRVAVDRGTNCWDLMNSDKCIPGVTTGVAAAMRNFVELVNRFREQLDDGPATDIVRRFIDAVGYPAELKKLYPDPLAHQARWVNVKELVEGLTEFEARARRRKRSLLGDYLNEIALKGSDFENEKETKLKQNAVGLLTLHAAKGLEFPVVYLVGLEEGLLPHYRSVKMGDTAIDEERRLCYVGVTRAEEHLTITACKTRRSRGRARPTDASRFLGEMLGKPVVFQSAKDTKTPAPASARASGRSSKSRAPKPRARRSSR